MTAQDEIVFCYSCGELNPTYSVEGYLRICHCGSPTVVTLTEAIDYLNQRYIYYGESVIKEDIIDEDYDKMELDFDSCPDLEEDEEYDN